MNDSTSQFSKQISVLGLGLVGFIIFAVLPPFLPGWMLFLMTVAWAKAIVVLGVVFLLRGGLVSFGHGMYFAIGAYAAGFGIKFLGIREGLVLALFGLTAGALLAGILGLLLARYKGIFFALLNMAFSMVLYALLLKSYAITGGSDGMSIRPPTIAGWMPPPEILRLSHYYFALGLAILVFFAAYRFATSPLGYTVLAIRDNEVRVEYMGSSVLKTIYFTYVFSGMLGGLGGVITGFAVGHIVPEYAYWTQSGEFVFVALLGGTGSVLAPIAGSIVFEFVRNYAFKLSPYTWQMSLGIVLLVIILFLPGGLWSLSEPISKRWKRWTSSLRRSA
jgi:branched-chain amino acid transport system permease protein